jgi:endoglucanase
VTRLRLSLLLVLATLATALLAPGGALSPGGARADTPTAGVPVCSATANVLDGVSGDLGLLSGDAKGAIGFNQASYTANEDAGEFWITITRTSLAGTEKIFYGVHQHSAQSPWDFTAVDNTEAVLVPGQASCQFPVTIADNGMNGPQVQAIAYLYGSSRAALPADPDDATLTILRNDPLAAHDAADPLGITPAPADGDPLTGAQFYVAPSEATGAGLAARSDLSRGDRTDATALSFIADQPTGYRFWYFKTPADPAPNVARYLENAQYAQPGKVVELSTYSLVHAPCGSTANATFTGRYLNWVRGLAEGIGNFHVVLFFELDSLITAPCLTPAERHIRLSEQLKPAIEILEAADPHLVLYLDAGASDALSVGQTARYLRQAGVAHAQGFFVNSTHFQWDTTETQFGQAVSRRLGGHVHFVLSSGVNGRGPLLNRHPRYQGVENLCNPVGRGLGTMSTQTGYTNLDGLLWFAPVGNSGGACGRGAPPTADFWPSYAVMLYRNRDFAFTGPKLSLSRDGTFVPYSAAFTL